MVSQIPKWWVSASTQRQVPAAAGGTFTPKPSTYPPPSQAIAGASNRMIVVCDTA
jgi:hypothetical protein